MSKKKHYNKSKKMRSTASIGKGVNATIEHLRHAEEGTLAHDIYRKGMEVNGHFAIEYRYMDTDGSGVFLLKKTYMTMGYFTRLNESGILIGFPNIHHIPWSDVQKMISDILPGGAKLLSVHNNDCTYYFIPFTPLVEECVIPCLAELDDYIRTSLDKQSNDLLKPIRVRLGLEQPNQ